jgi:hypothetical protein
MNPSSGSFARISVLVGWNHIIHDTVWQSVLDAERWLKADDVARALFKAIKL